ncbi:MAG: hypothetical protein AAF483_11435 [Planctomycetota bacterium]
METCAFNIDLSFGMLVEKAIRGGHRIRVDFVGFGLNIDRNELPVRFELQVLAKLALVNSLATLSDLIAFKLAKVHALLHYF